MLHAVLHHRDARIVVTEGPEPRGRALGVISLGGHEHPVHRSSLCRIGEICTVHMNDAFRRFHSERRQGASRAKRDVMLPRNFQQRSQCASNRAYSNDCHTRHCWPPLQQNHT